jgi:hypothetical protein
MEPYVIATLSMYGGGAMGVGIRESGDGTWEAIR